jgi:hypothetical protein
MPKFQVITDLPNVDQIEIDRILAIPVAKRTTRDANFLLARTPYLTNRIIELDADGNIFRASGLTVPTSYEGFSKGALFIKTDASTEAIYQNIGDATNANWELISSSGTSLVQKATVILIDPQIKTLNSAAPVLITAPGANKVIVPFRLILVHKYQLRLYRRRQFCCFMLYSRLLRFRSGF